MHCVGRSGERVTRQRGQVDKSRNRAELVCPYDALVCRRIADVTHRTIGRLAAPTPPRSTSLLFKCRCCATLHQLSPLHLRLHPIALHCIAFTLPFPSGMASTKEVPIPGPKGVPFLGNIYDIDKEVPLNSIELLADNYGILTSIHPQRFMRAILTSPLLSSLPQAPSIASPLLVTPAFSSALMNWWTRFATRIASRRPSLLALRKSAMAPMMVSSRPTKGKRTGPSPTASWCPHSVPS